MRRFGYFIYFILFILSLFLNSKSKKHYISTKFVRFPISVGIVPESLSDTKALLFVEFNDKDKYQKNTYKAVKFFKFPISVGIVPKRSFEANTLEKKKFVFLKLQKKIKWILWKIEVYRYIKFVIFPNSNISVGIVPKYWAAIKYLSFFLFFFPFEKNETWREKKTKQYFKYLKQKMALQEL